MSGLLLDELFRRDLCTVPLGDSTGWWRFREPFGRYLRTQLDGRVEPERRAELHRRAGAWLVDHGEWSRGLDHLATTGDVGSLSTVLRDRWLDALNDGAFDAVLDAIDGLPSSEIESSASLTMAAAWATMNALDLPAAERWGRALARTIEAGAPDRDQVRGGHAMFEAHLSRHLGRVGRGIGWADRCREEIGDEASPGRAGALAVSGQNLFWAGSPRAEAYLAEGLQVGREVGEHLSVITCLGHLGLLQLTEDRLAAARRSIDQAIGIAREQHLLDRQHTALASIADGALALAGGSLDDATRSIEIGIEKAERGSEPYERWFGELLLARVAHRRGDRPSTERILSRVRAGIATLDDPGVLTRLVDEFAAEVAAGPVGVDDGGLIDPLSQRELAVLRLLRGDLTQRQIADELYISFNTVRTHTKAIYRKLGASSRAEAVAAATDRGLLGR